ELDGNVLGGLLSNADAGLEQTSNKLAALDAIDATLARGDRRLLTLDLSGREAMAAVAVGDLDTADHVAVYTPGAGSTVQGNLPGYDAQLSALRDETRRQLEMAGREDETVAAVTWLNYQAPHWGWGLAFTERSPVSDLAATQAAPRLSVFFDGLGAFRTDTPHVTAVGHSYDIASLGLPSGAAYLVEAAGDYVADAGTFGGDPSFLDGLTRLSTDAGLDAAGNSRTGSTGHSAYLDPGSMSSYNIAGVVAGTAERSAR
ncbi:alpha/beta hydrolase, partial [Rhodococcus chondri]